MAIQTNILQYLEATAPRLPHKIAYADGRDHITFSELITSAKAVGSALLRLGCKREPIAILMEKHPKVPAAFFILDNLIKRNKDLVLRMRDEGHLVCNHTMRHRDMSKILDPTAFEAELSALEALYREEIGGEMAKYYRPPEGRFCEENLKQAQALGYKTVFWSIAYADWDNKKQPSEEEALKKLLDNTHNGAIVLLHPTSSTNAAILSRLIDAWRALGYRFGTLDELEASA